MLYLFYGTDETKTRAKVQDTVAALLKREPNASHVHFNEETFTQELLLEHLGGQGLFAGRVLVVLDHILGDKDKKEEFLEQLKDIKTSENIFILLEGKLDKKTANRLENQSEKTQEFSLKPTTSNLKPSFSIFKLTDALGNRSRKKAWVEYQRALRSGSRPEEIHGMLFWQTKSMLLVAQKATSGLKPFVVSKSKSFLNNWTEDELKKLSSNLVSIYHNSRRGGPELEIAIEQLVLGL